SAERFENLDVLQRLVIHMRKGTHHRSMALVCSKRRLSLAEVATVTGSDCPNGFTSERPSPPNPRWSMHEAWLLIRERHADDLDTLVVIVAGTVGQRHHDHLLVVVVHALNDGVKAQFRSTDHLRRVLVGQHY